MAGWGNPDVDRIAAIKGDPTPHVLDPNTEEVVGSVKTGRQVANPAPKIRYLFPDGTYVDVQTSKDEQGNSGPRTTIGGTALASAAKEEGPGGKHKPLMLNGTAYIDDPDNPGHLIPMPGAPAPGTPSPGTAPAAVSAEAKVQQAGVAQEKADTQKAYDQAVIEVRTGQLNANNYRDRISAYTRELETKVQLRQLDATQRDLMLKQWVDGATAAINAQNAATAQQNAETSAGNLGVARGNLGVSQETADTERERVVQTAGQNAVANTISLLSHYIPTSGPNDPFFTKFAGQLNRISGGKSDYTAADFMSPAPDLRSIADQASAQAVARMKGGVLSAPAPATAAAISATAVPTARAPLNVGTPPNVAAPAATALPQAPEPPPYVGQGQQTAPYMGPVTPTPPLGTGVGFS